MKNYVYRDLSSKKYTKNEFFKYVEKKVLKTVRNYDLIKKNEKIVVGLSGGKDSAVTLYLINKLFSSRISDISALAVDEGIKDYRDKTLLDAKKLCKDLNIPLKIFTYKKEIGVKIDKIAHLGNPCAWCGVFRRYLLNKTARLIKADKLATGHNLDDEAQSIIMNQFKGNVAFSAKLGPMTGALAHEKFVPRIKPLYFLTEKEVLIYSKLRGLNVNYVECPNSAGTFRDKVCEMLNSMENEYPGTKQGIVNGFLEILPKLKEMYKGQKIGSCKDCGEPAVKNKCRKCEMVDKLRLKKLL
jgi:tRNA-5-methyluridine54 2-sulfurtransferase